VALHWVVFHSSSSVLREVSGDDRLQLFYSHRAYYVIPEQNVKKKKKDSFDTPPWRMINFSLDAKVKQGIRG